MHTWQYFILDKIYRGYPFNIDCVLVYFLNLDVGATAHQSKLNLIGWLDTIILDQSQRIKRSEDRGTPIEATYEGMNCSDVQKIISVLEAFTSWRQLCEVHNISAGKMLVVTGNKTSPSTTWAHFNRTMNIYCTYWNSPKDHCYMKVKCLHFMRNAS